MDWTMIITIILVGLAGIVASISPFVIAWLLKQKWVQQLHLEGLIQAVIPQVVDWVEWWASHWNDPKGVQTGDVPGPKGAAKMEKALALLKSYIPGAKRVPDEILRLKVEVELEKRKKAA
jgi:hypothetical protein